MVARADSRREIGLRLESDEREPEVVDFAAAEAAVPVTSSLAVERPLLTSALAVTTVEDDLDAANAGEAHRQVLVER